LWDAVIIPGDPIRGHSVNMFYQDSSKCCIKSFNGDIYNFPIIS
jgi:hypothetical protein